MSESLGEILGMFLGDLNEQILRISENLLLLEGKGPGAEVEAEESFRRDAHSIKGTAASMGFEDIAALAHAIEDLASSHQEQARPVDAATVDLVLGALEALRTRADALEREGMSGTGGSSSIAQATERLRRAVQSTPSPSSEVAAAQPVAAPSQPVKVAAPVEETVRVARKQLQALGRRVDELRVLRGRLATRCRAIAELAEEIDTQFQKRPPARLRRELKSRLGNLRSRLLEDEQSLGDSVHDLEDRLRAVQLLPVSSILEPLRTGVLRHAKKVGKQVTLRFDPGEARADRRVLEVLKDPLVHLLRNAIDHGLELPGERAVAMKRTEGSLTVQATQPPGRLLIEVRDDGRGVDVERVRRLAVERKVISAEEAARLSVEQTRMLIFRAGFSTAEAVTETSGRGVGLDVVEHAVEELGGAVTLESEWGKGTLIRLSIPLAVSSAQVLVAEIAGRRIALEMEAVEQLLRVNFDQVGKVAGAPTLQSGLDELKLVSLAETLGLPEWEGRSKRLLAIVLRSRDGKSRVAARIERMVGMQEALLRPVPRELAGLKHLSAVADLGDGVPVFVFNDRLLFEAAERREPAPRARSSGLEKTILVVDDTVTTRALHRRVLENAGFRVIAAANGEEALRMLETQRVDLVVSDLEMPQLDGVGLLQRLRAHPRLARIPAVLVSSLAADSRKARKAEGLADAYVTKSAFDRGVLIDTVKLLLAERA